MTKKKPTRKPGGYNAKVPFNEWASPKNKNRIVRRWELLSVVNIMFAKERERVAASKFSFRRKIKELWPWKSSSPSSPDFLPASPPASSSSGAATSEPSSKSGT